MPFNDVDRVIYENNPLVEVICQLRFPRILIINESSPADFQDRIREDYPIYDVMVDHQQEFMLDAMGNQHSPMPRLIQSEQMKNYRFSSADGCWHINLTSTFISISTSKYVRWEDFYQKFKKPVEALIEIYKPAFFERIGLRYVDAFRKSKLNLENCDWSELIQPFALGFLANPQISGDVQSHEYSAELDIGNGANCQIKTALGFVNNIENVSPDGNPESSFIIDSDLFYMRKELSELNDALNYLHSISTKLIRAMITEKLHNAMRPVEL